MKNTIIVCDLDGTIVDSSDRIKEVEEKYKGEWSFDAVEEFLVPEKIRNDKKIEKACRILKTLWENGADIYFITGRSEQSRADTMKWLNKNLDWKFITGVRVPHILFMRRKEEGKLAPAEVKKKRIEELTSVFASDPPNIMFFDDDPDCVELYSKYGLSFKAPECWDFMEIEKRRY